MRQTAFAVVNVHLRQGLVFVEKINQIAGVHAQIAEHLILIQFLAANKVFHVGLLPGFGYKYELRVFEFSGTAAEGVHHFFAMIAGGREGIDDGRDAGLELCFGEGAAIHLFDGEIGHGRAGLFIIRLPGHLGISGETQQAKCEQQEERAKHKR